MEKFIKQHFPNDVFEIFIIEQNDENPFNRAWLANVGFVVFIVFYNENVRKANKFQKFQIY